MNRRISENKKDLHLIGGKFFDHDVPREKKYLLKYFKTPMHVMFVKYYLIFNDSINFVHHTGYYHSDRNLKRLKNKIEHIMNLYENAKKQLTEESMELIANIENGNCDFRLIKVKSNLKKGRPKGS